MTKLIYNDPGHGGIDPGAVANGRNEKDYNLQVTTKFTAALERCGFQVRMTRTTDTLPDAATTDIGTDLTYRAQLANNAGADLFVAWHADAANDPSVGGLAVWIHPSAKGTQTETWANEIGSAIANATGQPFRGVMPGDFAVLRETTMEAVLIEGDFISNPTMAQKLFDPGFQTTQAEAAARAVCGIFGVGYVCAVPVTPVAPFSTSAGQANIAWLGEYWKIAEPDVQKAAHWLGDQYRVVIGMIHAADACNDTSFTQESGIAVIRDQQAEFAANANDSEIEQAAKWGADLMRKLKGITAV